MAADVFLVSMFDYLADGLAAFLYVYARRRTVKVDLKSHTSSQTSPPSVVTITLRVCLIMLVNDRAEIFQTDLFLWRRSIADYATEAKG